MQTWTEEAVDCLKGCIDCTSWDIFIYANVNLDELNTVVTDYIHFCVDNVIPTKCIKIFPNDKPRINAELKAALRKKKQAFQQSDRTEGKMRENNLRQA